MYCPQCGGKNPDFAKFCGACGGEFPSMAVAIAEAAVPAVAAPVVPSPPPAQPARDAYGPRAVEYAAPAPPQGAGVVPLEYQAAPAKVSRHIVLVILAILVCLPLGIVAAVMSSQVKSRLAAEDEAGACSASFQAMIWALIGIVVGVLVVIGQIAG